MADVAPEGVKKSGGLGCLGLFAVIVGLPMLFIASCMFGGSKHESSPTGEEWAVLDTCHQAIEKSLKDPDSATYSDEVATMDIAHDNGAKWTASGTVRGTNSFGGVAAHTYTCTVDYTQDGEEYVASTQIVR